MRLVLSLCLAEIVIFVLSGTVSFALQDRDVADKLAAAQSRFRKFFLSLIANRSQREMYLSVQYRQEYGATFQVRTVIVLLSPTHMCSAICMCVVIFHK